MTKKELFIQKLKDLFPDKYDQIIENTQEPKKVVFRVNTIKAKCEDVLEELNHLGFKVAKTPLPESYVVIESPQRLSGTDLFKTGKIYIQSLSSMLPVIALDPKPGEKILDMCAAPGSKTSQIAQVTGNKAEIYAVENNRNRFFALKSNLENLEVKVVNIYLESAKGLDHSHPELTEYFDKILLDAPCSNEGNICFSDSKTVDKWNPKHAKRLSQLQKGLADTTVRLLKNRGTIVYSTCTYSKEENQDVVAWLLKRHKNLELLSQEQIFPDQLYSGFFIAKLQKVG